MNKNRIPEGTEVWIVASPRVNIPRHWIHAKGVIERYLPSGNAKIVFDTACDVVRRYGIVGVHVPPSAVTAENPFKARVAPAPAPEVEEKEEPKKEEPVKAPVPVVRKAATLEQILGTGAIRVE